MRPLRSPMLGAGKSCRASRTHRLTVPVGTSAPCSARSRWRICSALRSGSAASSAASCRTAVGQLWSAIRPITSPSAFGSRTRGGLFTDSMVFALRQGFRRSEPFSLIPVGISYQLVRSCLEKFFLALQRRSQPVLTGDRSSSPLGGRTTGAAVTQPVSKSRPQQEPPPRRSDSAHGTLAGSRTPTASAFPAPRSTVGHTATSLRKGRRLRSSTSARLPIPCRTT
jgi:hypothetical protein